MEIMFNALEQQERHERYIKEESMRKGEKKGKYELIYKMYKKGLKYETISEYTDFPIEQVEQIIKEASAKNSQKRSTDK